MPEQWMDGISSSSSDTCGAMAQAELIIPTLAVNGRKVKWKNPGDEGQILVGVFGFYGWFFLF